MVEIRSRMKLTYKYFPKMHYLQPPTLTGRSILYCTANCAICTTISRIGQHMTFMSLQYSPLRNVLSEHELLGTRILETAMNTPSCRKTTKDLYTTGQKVRSHRKP
jgi:hypothetical protein